MSQWIKIKDQLPEEGQAVIYYFEFVGVFGKRTIINRGKYKKIHSEIGVFDCFYGKSGFLCDDVTHWMPDENQKLPKPPN